MKFLRKIQKIVYGALAGIIIFSCAQVAFAVTDTDQFTIFQEVLFEAVIFPQGGSVSGSSMPLILKNVQVAALYDTAYLSWESNIPTRSRVSWGVTKEYEIAFLEGREYQRIHNTVLTGLVPGTQYSFKIIVRDSVGREVVLEQTFVTQSLVDTSAPANVSALRAKEEGTDVLLSWKNPTAISFDHVRIIRKEKGYPVDPADGLLIYEGKAEAYRDRDIFKNKSVVHYGVFAYDDKKNVSSGALVRIQKKGTVPAEDTKSEVGVPTPLAFSDLVFLENGKKVSFTGTEVVLKTNTPFFVRIPSDKLPESFKTIVFTLTDATDTDATFLFLLRINADKTAYEAQIDGLEKKGTYPISLSILDNKGRTISKVEGHIVAKEESLIEGVVTGVGGFLTGLIKDIGYGFIIFTLFMLCIFLYFFSRRLISA